MSKVRVLAIPSDSHGVGKYRIIDPFTYIGDNHSDEVHVDLVFDVPNENKFFDNYDIVYFHSFIHKGESQLNLDRINWLKKEGIKVVMDIDDFWRVDHRHPNYETFKRNGYSKLRAELLKSADYVTTTTPIYQKTIKSLLGIKNVSVFPNAVNEKEPQFKPKPKDSDLVRFGWLGGSSHLHDLELIKSGISTITQQYKGKTQFVLCGFDLRGNMKMINRQTGQMSERPIKPMETVWFKYENIFTNDYRSVSQDYKNHLHTFTQTEFPDELNQPYVRRWTMDINKYASNYNYFDVSLAPLVKSEFNANKSQLKVIEAGFHKKAIIATEEDPYLIDLVSSVERGGGINPKGNSLLVSTNKNHKQWGKHMKKLIENPNMIEDLGNKLYETVKDKYSLATVSKDRVEFLKSIIKK
jgi:glycosyltransferase involved in cell wall biosynthesis